MVLNSISTKLSKTGSQPSLESVPFASSKVGDNATPAHNTVVLMALPTYSHIGELLLGVYQARECASPHRRGREEGMLDSLPQQIMPAHHTVKYRELWSPDSYAKLASIAVELFFPWLAL